MVNKYKRKSKRRTRKKKGGDSVCDEHRNRSCQECVNETTQFLGKTQKCRWQSDLGLCKRPETTRTFQNGWTINCSDSTSNEPLERRANSLVSTMGIINSEHYNNRPCWDLCKKRGSCVGKLCSRNKKCHPAKADLSGPEEGADKQTCEMESLRGGRRKKKTKKKTKKKKEKRKKKKNKRKSRRRHV